MTKRSSTYLKSISETGDIANQTLFEDLIDSMGVVDEETTFDDSGSISITKDATYSTTRTVTGSTHTLTFATTGNVIGKCVIVEYTFQQNCTLTLTNLNTTFSTLGTITPIPAGTYPFWIFVNPKGTLSLVIQNNINSSQSQLDAPTNFQASAGNLQVSLSWSAVANATNYVLQYYPSTDVGNWQNVSDYSDTTQTSVTHTGLTNGVQYFYRLAATASGYSQSPYAQANATPSISTTQLTAISDLSATSGNGQVVLSFTNPNSGNEDDNLVQYSTDNFVANTVNGITIASGGTGGTQTGLTNETLYYFRIISRGSGSYSNSDPSNVDQATPTAGVNPSALTNLEIWLDATDSVTEAGTGVSQWTDKSGNGYHFTQGTDANRPTYDGTDTITFNSTNSDYLDGSTHLTNIASNNAGELFAVVKKVTDADFGFSLMIANSADNSSQLAFGPRGNGTPTNPDKIGATIALSAANGAVVYDDSIDTADQFYIINISSNGARWRMMTNGSEKTVTKNVTGGTVADGAWINDIVTKDKMAIGALLRSSPVYYNVAVKEIIYCSSEQTTGDRGGIFNYLNAKYSVY